LEDVGLYDVEPTKLRPTWRNKWVREDRIAKRLDRFLLFEAMINEQIRVRQLELELGRGAGFYHFSIFLGINGKKTPKSLQI
jgi:hypothetical protein